MSGGSNADFVPLPSLYTEPNWADGSAMAVKVNIQRNVQFEDTSFLAVGGQTIDSSPVSQKFDLDHQHWRLTNGQMVVHRQEFGAVLLSNNHGKGADLY